MISQNEYFLPLNGSDMIRTASDSRTHRRYTSKNGETYDLTHAIDFLCNEGSSVKAALEGKVVFIQDGITKNWDKWDIPPEKVMQEDEQDGNYVFIEHANKEFSIYSHLIPKEISVKVGDYVKTGQVIGKSGNTGWSIKPHLHFMVRRFTKPKPHRDFESLEINWRKK
jgi:murein DD-endopeptidase MepM/ murein hydrolase activator NlpD